LGNVSNMRATTVCLTQLIECAVDGQRDNLACGTTGGKVFVHDPHTKLYKGDMGSRLLNLNREVTSLAAGVVGSGGSNASLSIGGASSLQVYDVPNNRDLYFKDIPDGVSAAAVGKVGSLPAPLAIVGGNCTVQGFDGGGAEAFWTVTGDNVTAMTTMSSTTGKPQLLVGSADFELRWVVGEDAIGEVTETGVPTALVPVHSLPGSALYALKNGTVGKYTSQRRLWRLKSKSVSCAVGSYDLSGDGVHDVLVGWASGLVEARKSDTGALISKDNAPDSVAGLVTGDIRGDGRSVALAVGASGAVRGYMPLAGEALTAQGDAADANVLQSLRQTKAALDMQLRTVEAGSRVAQGQGPVNPSAIPAATAVGVRLLPAVNSLQLVATTNNECIVHSVVAFNQDCVAFPTEACVFPSSSPSQELAMPLMPSKDVETVVNLQVLVGLRPSSTAFHVFETTQRLPRFAAYAYQGSAQPQGWQAPPGGVHFPTKERCARLGMWVAQSFVVPESATGLGADGSFHAHFRSLRDGSPVSLHMQPSTAGNGQLRIACEDMQLAGDLVQGIASYFALTELAPEVHFPTAMGTVGELARTAAALSAVRQRFSAEMADASHAVKVAVVRAEDSRLLGDMTGVKRSYAALMSMNEELVGEYRKRALQHSSLVSALKDINGFIQKASRLRVGPAAAKCVAACREAIKKQNMAGLPAIMMAGNAV